MERLHMPLNMQVKKKVECLNITTECRDTFMISKNVKIEKSTISKNNTLI